MIGMDFFYADQQAQSPCGRGKRESVAICRLVDDGYLNSILMSQDVFSEDDARAVRRVWLRLYLKHFVPRLKRHGRTTRTIDRILIENPRRVFSGRASRALRPLGETEVK